MSVKGNKRGHSGKENWQDLEPLLARHPLFAKKSAEQHYPFTKDDLHKHSGWLNFEVVSGNCEIKWTEALIEEFVDHWDWDILTATVFTMTETPLSKEFIVRHEDQWDPVIVGMFTGETVLEDVLGDETDEAADLPVSKGEASTDGVTTEEIEAFKWTEFSSSSEVEWTVPVLLKHEGQLDWKALASNEAVWVHVLEPHATELLAWLSSAVAAIPKQSARTAGETHGLDSSTAGHVNRVVTSFGPGARVVGVVRNNGLRMLQ